MIRPIRRLVELGPKKGKWNEYRKTENVECRQRFPDSSQMTPVVRTFFCTSALCNQRASMRIASEKVTGLLFDVESGRDGRTKASNVRPG